MNFPATTPKPDVRQKAVRIVRLPFEAGARAIERIGVGASAVDTVVVIALVDGDLCVTHTGRWYCRHTGARAPKDDGPYRALRPCRPNFTPETPCPH